LNTNKNKNKEFDSEDKEEKILHESTSNLSQLKAVTLVNKDPQVAEQLADEILYSLLEEEFKQNSLALIDSE